MTDWRPSASLEMLRQRAALIGRVRQFFADRNVMEVETPLLSRAAITDPNLHSLAVTLAGEPETYLQTSPEFFMKRLLAFGSGDIWQMCKVFRGAEQGRWHNPEFTMLEWYRTGFDHHQLMDEVAALFKVLMPEKVSGGWRVIHYADAFAEFAGIDPFAVTDETLAVAVQRFEISAAGLDRDAMLDLLASHCVYPQLGHGEIVFVDEFPLSQAALAKASARDARTANRFEAFVDGIELANGFHELTDAAEQARRFATENARRAAMNLPAMPMDDHLLAALDAGLPECSGVAVGFDRVVALALGAQSLQQVLSFDFSRI